MPSYNIDPNDVKSMARLLVAVCKDYGGILRINAATYDGIDKGRLLVVDYDRDKSQIVITATTESGRVTIVPPENHGWVRPPEESQREQRQVEAQKSVQRRIVRSDEELAELEEERNKEAALAREVSQGGTTTRFRNVPPGQNPAREQ